MTAPEQETTLTAHPAFHAYRRELALWLSGDVDDDQALVPVGAELCAVARAIAMTPEHLLVTIRDGRPAPVARDGTDRAARESQARAHRYTLAVNLLLDCFF